MIKELKVTEREYRGVKLPSYSLLKRLDNLGPKAILTEFKGGSEVMEFGDLLDTLLLQPEELDNKFYFKPIEKPKPQLQDLADFIINKYNKNPANEEILELSKDLNLFGRQKDETRLKTFDVDEFWNYIEAKREANGKTVFSPKTLDDANTAIAILKTHEKTSHLFKESDDIEHIDQLKLCTIIDDMEVKGMLDKVILNHKEKIITPYDLKATDVKQRSFPYIFNKMKYYLQSSLYHRMIVDWAKEYYPDYTVEEFKFIVYSRADRYPFVWVVSDSVLNNGFYGYTDYKEKKIKGVVELLTEYYYYMNSENFIIEKEFVENSQLYLL